MTSDADLRAAIADQRSDLADVLAALDGQDWDRQTLCEGWRVHEVVAHITEPFRYSLPRTMLELVRSAGRWNRAADRTARRDAQALSPRQLVATLRDNVDHDWRPPGSGYEAALSHDLIHGLDITVGLELDHRMPLDRVQTVLDNTGQKEIRFFGANLDGVELHADDLEWRFGSGERLHGRAQDLLLVLCGRKLPPGLVRGAPSHRYVRAAPKSSVGRTGEDEEGAA